MIFQDRNTGYVYQFDDGSSSEIHCQFRHGEVIEPDYDRTRWLRLRSLFTSRPQVMIVAEIRSEVINGKRYERVIFGSRQMTWREWLSAVWRAIG